MSIIKPEYLTFDDLLQKRFFEIPNYQRAYSWVNKQREDLFDDISKIADWKDKDRHHFLATIVCLNKRDQYRNVGTDEYRKYEVVDGQQRLTTLIILLKSISKTLSSGNKDEKNEAKRLDNILIKDNGKIILLQTNHDSSNIFRNYIQKGTIPDKNKINTHTELNLCNAFSECEKFVDKWKKKKDVLLLLSMIKNRLGFIFYVLEDSGSVYSVFEVLNSRGLEVDWLDKCKSMLMGILFEKYEKEASHELISELHKLWTKIYRKLGVSQISGEEILKISSTLEIIEDQSKLIQPEEALEFFRRECSKNPKKIFTYTELLLDVAEILKELNADIKLKAVGKISQSRLLWTSIYLSKLKLEEKKYLIELWEKLSFTIYGIYRSDARYSVGDLVRLARIIHKNKSTLKSLEQEFKKISLDYPIANISEKLWEKNCYEYWSDELRYFFFKYEEYLNSNNGSKYNPAIWRDIWNNSPTRSIEHIFPQTPNKDWQGKLGKGKDVIENNKHRLGNLFLLPLDVNKRCAGKIFKEKKKIYKEQLINLKDEIIKCSDWNINEINKREKRLIEWAKITWGF